MTDLYMAEGFYYSRDHLLDFGLVEHPEDETLFAYHGSESWETIMRLLRDQWGYGAFWDDSKLIKKTPMRDGRTNYVFRITRL